MPSVHKLVKKLRDMPYNRRQALIILGFIVILIAIPVTASLIKQNPSFTGKAAVSTACQYLSNPSATGAFCDDFSQVSPGGRGGDIDESKWSVSRIVGEFGNGRAIYFPQVPVPASCKGTTTAVADNDILRCTNGRLLVASAAQNYNYIALRPRQQFDFAGRTGTIVYDVDAYTEGSGSFWTSLYITDDSNPGANSSGAVTGGIPRHGIGINFDDTCQTSNRMSAHVYSFNNHQETFLGNNSRDCVTTQRGSLNHIEVRLSQTSLEVWATDAGGTNFKRIATANINLPFSKGYVHYQVAERAPVKYSHSPGYFNYYLDNLGFDGPTTGVETGYSLPDSLTPLENGVQIGYSLFTNPYNVPTLTIPNVSLSGVTSAKLAFTISFVWQNADPNTATVHYRLNGGAWRLVNETNMAAAAMCQAWGGQVPCTWAIPFVTNVVLSDLRSGNNTVEIVTDGTPNSWAPILANVDLLTFGGTTPPPTCTKVGDLNCDNLVNVFDLSILLSKWGSSDVTADINHSGKVDVFDLSTLLSKWGS